MARLFLVFQLKTFVLLYMILLFSAGQCWPRYKRSNEIDSTFTASLYEKLKKSLEPVLEKTVDLSATPVMPINNKNKRKPFKGNGKDKISQTLEQNAPKRSSSISKAFPASRKYDINTILIPHRGNQSALAVADHENDYDYGDRDLPDIEEPPAHIFEYNRVNSSNKKIAKVAFKPKISLNYPLFPTEFGNSYEKCKQNLEPLIQTDLKPEKLTKLEEKLLAPYVKLIPDANDRDKDTASKSKFPGFIVTPKHFEYSSLYDQFKKRLESFSDELGIDSGLSKGSEAADSNSFVNYSRKSFKDPQELSYAFQKAQALLDHMKKQGSVSLEKRQNCLTHDTESHPKHKRANGAENGKVVNTAQNSGPARNNFGADFDFWLQQRGYQYRNHKNEPTIKLVADNADNNEKYDANSGFDSHDASRTTNDFKSLQMPIEFNTRLFRGINDMSNNFLPDKVRGIDGSSLNKFYPNVLIEPVPTPLGTTSKLSARSLLEDVAHKLNMTTLEVAKKIAAIQDLNLTTLKADPELHNTLQQYIENSVLGSAFQDQVGLHLPKAQVQTPIIASQVQHNQNHADMGAETAPKSQLLDGFLMPSALNNGCPWEQTKSEQKPDSIAIPLKKCGNKSTETTGSNTGSKAGLSEEQVSKILEKLLGKLQEIQFEKVESEPTTTTPMPLEDIPCKLSGSWFSAAMGLRFDLSLNNVTEQCADPEAERLGLAVEVKECVPPRPHDIIDTKWPFVGSTIKEMGGPFFLYTQKKCDSTLATFVGFCRTCGNMDTIFGTWSFSLPSRSCQDTPASFQTKNDVMHRFSLDTKRRERYKDLLYKKSKYVLKNV